jgi:hypothetical protein
LRKVKKGLNSKAVIKLFRLIVDFKFHSF